MSLLYAKLQEVGGVFATLNESKLKNIIQLSCCILKSRSCNLQKCRDELSGVTGEFNLKPDTAYARLKRVFQTGAVDPILKIVFLLTLYLLRPSGQVLLIVDRTDFQLGGLKWSNLLVFGMEWNKVFIPLVWRDLGQRGNSTQKDRTLLLDRLLAWWKASGLALPAFCLTADREFTGHDWLTDLDKRGLDYVIRIKSSLRFEVWHNGQLTNRTMHLKTLARYMRRYGKKSMEIVIGGSIIVNVMIFPQENPKDKEDFVLLVTNLDYWEQCRDIFRRRWPIECCFKHLKTNGYDLEDHHLEGVHKSVILFAIVSLVYVLTVFEGVEQGFDKKVKYKKYPNAKRYHEMSLFRYGLYFLKQKIQSTQQFAAHLVAIIDAILKNVILIKNGVQP